MGALSRDEIEQMHDRLRKAFEFARKNWDWDSRYAGEAAKRESARDLSLTAGALLQADERLREFDHNLVTKPKLQPKA